jgi:hypothetical protein
MVQTLGLVQLGEGLWLQLGILLVTWFKGPESQEEGESVKIALRATTKSTQPLIDF